MDLPPPALPVPRRDVWVDNLRLLIIGLVVNMHACVTYSHVGSWYLMESPEPPLGVKLWFALWQLHLQSFFMGLLFFLAGFFSWRSLEKRGPVAFVRERTVRLGIPAALFMLLLHPLVVMVLLGREGGTSANSLAVRYAGYVSTGRVLSGSGPLWFALALLLFSAVLALWWSVRRREGRTDSQCRTKSPPGLSGVVGLILVLVITTFGVRVWFPIGTSHLNFQLCFFPQYILAFALGVAAQRGGWLASLLRSPWSVRAGWLGVIGGPIGLVTVVWLGGTPSEHGHNLYEGGWNGQALGLVCWEQFTGVFLSLGLMALFSRFCGASGRVVSWFSDRAFAVYVVHTPILVALTPLLRGLGPDPAWRALVLTALGLSASFAAADLVRRVPGLGSVL